MATSPNHNYLSFVMYDLDFKVLGRWWLPVRH